MLRYGSVCPYDLESLMIVSRRVRAPMLAVALLALAACTPSPPTSPTAGVAPVQSASTPAVEAPVVATGEDAQVLDRLKKTYPNLQISSLRAVAMSDGTRLYEFTLPGMIAYTNATTSFVLVGGELITGAGDQVQNVTKSRAQEMGNALYKNLPFAQSIKYVYGNGERQAFVFTDPDCPFCQAFEAMMAANTANLNATVYVLPYPMDNSHPKADAKARYIWCTANPAQAWTSWMTSAAGASSEAAVDAAWSKWSASNPSTAGCPAAANVDTAKQLGFKLGINQTPTVIFTNGMPFYGAPTRGELDQAWAYVRDNPVVAPVK